MNLKGAAKLQNQIPHCGVSPYRHISEGILPPPSSPSAHRARSCKAFRPGQPLPPSQGPSALFSLALLLLPCLSKPFVLPGHVAWQAVFESLPVQWVRQVQEK